MNDLLWFVVVSLPLIVIVAFTVIDVLRRHDLAVGKKVVWVVVVILLPAVGTVIYLVARPLDRTRPAEGSARSARIVDAVRRHESGEMSDNDFAAAKKAILSEIRG